MSVFPKVMIVGFALSVCLGADYYNQSNRAGASPAEFGAAEYFGSVEDRYHEYVNDQRRDKLPLVSFLPEPTGNWIREPWSRKLETILKGDGTGRALRALMVEEVEKEDAGIANLFRVDLMAGFSRKSRTSVYYYRGTEIIEVTIRKHGSGGLNAGQAAAMEIAMKNMAAMSDREVFARIRGVPYIQSSGMGFMGEAPGDDWTRLRSIKGEFGNVRISVRAKARTASIKGVLSRIDYDGIIAALQQDVEGVGNQVVNSLPQIKGREYKSIEMQRIEAERAVEAESAWDRFLAFLGFSTAKPEPTRGVVVNRGNAASTCSGLARECGGRMTGQRFGG